MIPARKNNLSRIQAAFQSGLKKGWQGLIWLLKIILPISFFTALLVHFGIIYKLDFLLTPLMHALSLPASAALVLVVGVFTGIYGTVAALAVMPFAMEHMILIAVFTLISHNLIQESLVQGSSGINPFLAAGFRLFMAFAVTFTCARVMDVTPETGHVVTQASLPGTAVGFSQMLLDWGKGTGRLVIQIFCIIMPLMVILEFAKVFRIIEIITRMISPVLKLMGLDRSCGMLWLTAAVFGLAYGAAVIVEETRNNPYKKDDLTQLHLSLGVNHAMIEDPALFLPLGLPVFWLWFPRLVAAILSAWLFRGFVLLRRRYAQRAGHKKFCNH